MAKKVRYHDSKTRIVNKLKKQCGLESIKALEEAFEKGDIKITRKKNGRPSKLTDEVKAMIVNLSDAGFKMYPICKILNLDYGNFLKWIKKPHNSEFRQTIKNARVKAFLKIYTQVFDRADSGHWKSQEWILERVFGDMLEQNLNASPPSEEKIREMVIKVTEYKPNIERLKLMQEEKNAENSDEISVEELNAEELGENLNEEKDAGKEKT